MPFKNRLLSLVLPLASILLTPGVSFANDCGAVQALTPAPAFETRVATVYGRSVKYRRYLPRSNYRFDDVLAEYRDALIIHFAPKTGHVSIVYRGQNIDSAGSRALEVQTLVRTVYGFLPTQFFVAIKNLPPNFDYLFQELTQSSHLQRDNFASCASAACQALLGLGFPEVVPSVRLLPSSIMKKLVHLPPEVSNRMGIEYVALDSDLEDFGAQAQARTVWRMTRGYAPLTILGAGVIALGIYLNIF